MCCTFVVDSIGVLESVKSASDIITPVSGIIKAKNNVVEENPETINDSPYDEGSFCIPFQFYNCFTDHNLILFSATINMLWLQLCLEDRNTSYYTVSCPLMAVLCTCVYCVLQPFTC